MASKYKFLIVDGYPKESRDQFNEVGMTLAGDLYARLLKKRLPEADYDIWYSSDPGAASPTASCASFRPPAPATCARTSSSSRSWA